jgi:hypothetical protein
MKIMLYPSPSVTRSSVIRSIAALLLSTIASTAVAGQLLQNPSFETPVLSSSDACFGIAPNCKVYNRGENFPGWEVIGTGQSLYALVLLNNQYAERGGTLRFTTPFGTQSLDLTGAENRGPNGVQQTVATVADALYTLSFQVGNQDNRYNNYPTASSIDLLINGSLVGTYTNSTNSPNDVNWAGFTHQFKGVGSSTTIAFISATTADNYAGLDLVELTGRVPGAVPEPSSIALCAAGAIALLSLRRPR